MNERQRLMKLRKELRRVKHKMIKYNKIRKSWDKYFNFEKNIMEYSFPTNVWDYIFITKDGTKYIIDHSTKVFPDVKFSNIIYIMKTYYYPVGYSFKYDKYDNVSGNIYNNWEYNNDIEHKFGVNSYWGF